MNDNAHTTMSPYHFALLRMIFAALFIAQHTYLAKFRLTTFVSALMFVLAFAQVCVWSTWLSPYLLTEGRVTLHTILFASLAFISVAFLLREKGTLAFLFLFIALSATLFIETFAGKGLSSLCAMVFTIGWPRIATRCLAKKSRVGYRLKVNAHFFSIEPSV